MILWKDLAPQINAEEANQMLSTLFEPEDILSLSVKSQEDGVLTQRFVAGAGIPQDNLESLCAHGDVYVGIATLKSAEYTPRKRVKKEDVKSVGVLYADLDVKPGSFETQEAALAFLNYLPPTTLIVSSSTGGGLHAYWKLEGAGSKELLRRWWIYMQALAEGRSIDKLTDVTRMLRLAGSWHWPKNSSQTLSAVHIEAINHSARLSPQQVLELTEDAVQDWDKQVMRVQRDEANSYIPSKLEEYVNQCMSWQQILEPMGWSDLGQDAEGRTLWSRPGVDYKSGATDWPESPNVLSLFSDAVETNLKDLKDAGVTLSKVRVLQRLYFDDSAEAMASYYRGAF